MPKISKTGTSSDYCFILPVEGKVKYHMKLDCESLNRGFKNFFMPEVIIRLEKKEPEKHQNIVEDIRNWFVQNNYTISRYEKNEINSSEMTMNFNSHFPKKYDIEPISISDKLEDNFEWYISKKTNKIDETKNEFNYDDFIKNIFLVIKKRHTLCNSLDKDNLSRFDYMLKMVDTDINVETDSGKLSNLKYCISKMGIAKLKEFWSEHINLKNQVTKMLTEYFKWSYNFKEKQFDAIYLESFNLAKCRMCKDE